MARCKAVCKKRYIKDHGAVSIKVLSRVGKIPQGYIRKWMDAEHWEDLCHENPGDVVELSDKTKDFIAEGAKKYKLTEQEELFCYHYLKTFNSTTSAARAGYSAKYAHRIGGQLIHTPRIKDFIRHIKSNRDEELFVDAMDIVKQYLKIAFADMTDIAIFKGNELRFRSSSEVDGQLISEVSQGKAGLKIKLEDRLEALKRLERFYFILPIDTKMEIEKERLKLAKKQYKLEKYKVKGDNGTQTQNEIDKFIQASSPGENDIKGLFNDDGEEKTE